MPYLSIIITSACAALFWRAAEFENVSRWLWGGLSFLISAAMFFFFHWGLLGIVLGQIGLFIGITIFRIQQKP